ncbi:hypothetical protein NDU88_006530 [Pleurodeles waltl]|uniref:Uncharacterized protein n=1 Tax=Pleurodeles waltl TaxID=8319 RepID=A0AAV7UPZ3_PLEWA|nr:hypothetical protein NDU88_006530 [Pleurodeles waltl]
MAEELQEESNHKVSIKSLITQELKELVHDSVRQVLEDIKRNTLGEDEYFSLSEGEDIVQRGPGGKCMKKQKHVGNTDDENGVPSSSHRVGARSSISDGKVLPVYNEDEYILDLDYKDSLDDKFEGSSLHNESDTNFIATPLGQNSFDPKEITHPHGCDWWALAHVADYIKKWIRKPLEDYECNRMRTE